LAFVIRSVLLIFLEGTPLKKLFLALCLSIALFTLLPTLSVHALDISNGAKIFTANCSACHLGGNNVIIASKTLKKEALEKYAMNSLDAIRTQVTNGKNAMPSFKSRLNETQVEDVAAYVLGQAAKGW
jgi:cytochrome c6